MQREIIPDGEVPEEVRAFIDRMNNHIEDAILTAQGIFRVRSIPDRPVPGVLFYLTEDVSETITAGYWTWFLDNNLPDKGYWEKLVVGSELNALEERVSALEAP